MPTRRSGQIYPLARQPKGRRKIEQLNTVGKLAGNGVVAHKATLVNALSRGLADSLTLLHLTIGRRGLLGYLKALAGSNIVKIVPVSDSAGESAG